MAQAQKAEQKLEVVEADAVVEESQQSEAKKPDAEQSEADRKAAAQKEIEEIIAQAQKDAAKEDAEKAASLTEEEKAAIEAKRKADENDPVKKVAKMIAASRGEFGEEEKKAQKEITLVNDVDKAVRWVGPAVAGACSGVAFGFGLLAPSPLLLTADLS
jgi:hypothetical protein